MELLAVTEPQLLRVGTVFQSVFGAERYSHVIVELGTNSFGSSGILKTASGEEIITPGGGSGGLDCVHRIVGEVPLPLMTAALIRGYDLSFQGLLSPKSLRGLKTEAIQELIMHWVGAPSRLYPVNHPVLPTGPRKNIIEFWETVELPEV